MSSDGEVEVEGRRFTVRLLKAKNGCFLLIYEGPIPVIGAIAISYPNVPRQAASLSLTPRHQGEVVARLLAEAASGMIGGLSVCAFASTSEVGASILRAITSRVRQILLEGGR